MNMDYLEQARIMCEEIEKHAAVVNLSVPDVEINEHVLEVMRAVPRHLFVPEESIDNAYIDSPLAIGNQQTISQPYIVALMTSMLQLKSSDVILEIGTGSGYQTAILSKLVKKVYTLETILNLSNQAAKRFAQLQLNNIYAKNQNGVYGWPDAAPFDGIIVTAAATKIPHALITQLKPGARMVIPLEDAQGEQHLYLIKKHKDTSHATKPIIPVRFVPFQNEDQNH
jgi:protein-L-isoaspartate(D-aspartate) O-methyltransferase